MKTEILTERTEFNLKTPLHKGRATFAIVKRTVPALGKPRSETLKLASIDALNKLYKAGSVTAHEAVKQAEEIRDQLYRDLGRGSKALFNTENQKVLDAYWEDEYADRDNVDPDSARQELVRAMESIGSLSILSASGKEMQAEIKRRTSNPAKQARLIGKLKQVLKYLGRTKVKFRRVKKTHRNPQHLTLEEFKKVEARLDEPLRTIANALFYTGCRFGEAFALTPGVVGTTFVQVNWQFRRVKKSKPPRVEKDLPKNRKRRKAFLIPGGGSYVNALAALPEAERIRLRLTTWSKPFTEACKEVFPNNPEKWCNFHDLRHSYAIHLLNQGVSLSHVARSLGDSDTVTAEYYAGFTLTDDGIDAIAAVVRAKTQSGPTSGGESGSEPK